MKKSFIGFQLHGESSILFGLKNKAFRSALLRENPLEDFDITLNLDGIRLWPNLNAALANSFVILGSQDSRMNDKNYYYIQKCTSFLRAFTFICIRVTFRQRPETIFIHAFTSKNYR